MHVNKRSLSDYMIYYCSFIVILVTAFVIFIIAFFNDANMRINISSELKRSGKSFAEEITYEYGEYIIDGHYRHGVDDIQHIILKENNELIWAETGDNIFADDPVCLQREVKVYRGDDWYYFRDIMVNLKPVDPVDRPKTVVVRSYIPESKVLEDYDKTKRLASTLIMIILFFCTIIVYVMIKRINAPIIQMRQLAEKIGDGADISHRLEIEEGSFMEIEALFKANNTVLDKAERLLQVQTQFSSDVAHELKTPMTVIGAECQYAQKYLTSDPELLETFQIIESQVQKTNGIIHGLFELTKLEQNQVKIEIEEIFISEMIYSICESEPLFKKKSIAAKFNLTECAMYGDITLLMIAFRNIINNALKYSDEDTVIEITTYIENEMYIFQCKDYGYGMDQEEIDNMFLRFYRSDRSRNSEGLGLGMTITKKIIEMHGGDIKIQSEKGSGTTFTVILPLKKD